MKCKQHDVIVLSLKVGGHMSVCARCRKVLVKPANTNLTDEEVDVLIEFAIALREKKPSKISISGEVRFK